MAARYEPADARENVGGDWFDAAPLVDPLHPDVQILAVSVGDIIGHTLHAATIMGQVRSMLRQSAWDHPGGPPSVILGAFETANLGLGLTAAGTTVVTHLCRTRDDGWTMTWTNAGHPPPILLLPDGTAEVLSEHDALFGFALTSSLPRRDHQRDIAPGAPCSSTPTAWSNAGTTTSTPARTPCSPSSTRSATGRRRRSST